MQIVPGSSLTHYVDLYRLRRCFPVSLLRGHPIASTCTLRWVLPSLSRRLNQRLGGRKNLNSLRHIGPTMVSIIDQFNHVRLYSLLEGKVVKGWF